MPSNTGKTDPYLLPPDSAAAIYQTIDGLRVEMREDRQEAKALHKEIIRGIGDIQQTLNAGKVMFERHSLQIEQNTKDIGENAKKVDALEKKPASTGTDKHGKKETDFRIKVFNVFVLGIVTVLAASLGGLIVKVGFNAVQESAKIAAPSVPPVPP